MTIDATILIIEDDLAMCAGLRDNLEIEGYRVQCATSVQQGRTAALHGNPDLIVLDVMLPDGDGVTLCRDLRANGLRQPIIMLTARGEELNKVEGFESGADDYVVKPFGLRELLARIHAQLRRTTASQKIEGLVAVGISTVDFRRHELTRGGLAQEVSAKELELLRYLVIHRGEVVSRETLLTHVWGHQREVETRTVDNFIVRLRKKIEVDPATPQFLITIHGSGYKLIEQ